MSDHQYRVLKTQPGPDIQVGVLKLNKHGLSYIFMPYLGIPLSFSDVQGLNKYMQELDDHLYMEREVERAKKR